jgi:glycosyltransferase involved in cell wall biosynthesis
VVAWNYDRKDVYAREIQDLGIPLYPISDAPRYQKVRELRYLVKALEPEVLHSYSFYTNFPAWWCTRRSKTIPLGSIRGNFLADRQKSGKIIGSLSARWPSDQICNSYFAKLTVEACSGPFKPSRLLLVPNKLDTARFKPVGRMPSIPSLLAVGRLSSEKRWDILLAVIALLQERGLSCSVRLAGDGPLRRHLQGEARRLKVERLITFLGNRSDIPDLLSDSTFLIHTADEEGCPNAVMEAMACGRAVVATDAGDVPRLVVDEGTGYIVKRGDVMMLADRAAKLIENPPLAVRMGLAGRVKAEEEFGLWKLVDQTFEAYRAAGWKG